MRGRETWQDIMDSGVLVEWELWDQCKAVMLSPEENDELVYDLLTPAKVERLALLRVQPSFWEQDVDWSFHEIDGSDLEPRPDEMKGNNDFDVTYTKLPDKNSSFAFWDVEARFVTERAKKAGCKDAKRKVGYFFARDATNHGGPPGPTDGKVVPKGPTPNWFHYWMQTKARAGVPADFVRYRGQGPTCAYTEVQTVKGKERRRTVADAYAVYWFGDRHITMCDLAMPDLFFIGWNPLGADFAPEGIDLFGATILHEKQHHDDYWRWWSTGYRTADDSPDEDHIPNQIEKYVPVPSQVRTRRKCFDRKIQGPCFNPKLYDSFGYKINDEHYLAWAAMYRWPMGSADREDWSCPGKQTRGNCR
jgi:hypothetical protein